MRLKKTLSLSILPALALSCSAQKKVPEVTTPVRPVVVAPPKPAPAVPKPVYTSGEQPFFYHQNIADASKGNDNTMSYGSIVSAKPAGYTVTRTYFPSVAQGFRQRFIVLHYTSIDNATSLRALTKNDVSAHYLINDLDDREVYQLVDENKRAYHAGVSSWRGAVNLNDSSIGIEIVNQSTDIPGGYDFKPFPDYQIRKVAALVKDLMTRYSIYPQNIVAHSDIAPARKQDPGPLFPWKRLYTEYGIGMWYDEAAKNMAMQSLSPDRFLAQQNSSEFISNYQTMLRNFGYALPTTGINDNLTKKTVTAFQYHFRPEIYDGVMDLETFAILQALNEKYSSK